MRTLTKTAIGILLLVAAWPLTIAVAASGLNSHAIKFQIKPPTPSGGKSHKKHHRSAPALVTLHVQAGYGGGYRPSAWTPVRTSVHNRTGDLINATVEIDDRGTQQQGPPRTFRSVYSSPLVLPAGATKAVTLYMPGYDVQSVVNVSVRAGTRTLASSTTEISNFGDSTLSIGTMTTDLANAGWLKRVSYYSGGGGQLTPATLDPYAQALANFDMIVISDVASSRLGPDQFAALEQYVRNGGALMLVGGPDWQETLKPLPAALVPGQITGTATMKDLRGLLAIKNVALPHVGNATTVSVLTHPRGSVLASQDGIPLVVRSALGSGQITYLAFDPAVAPVPHWKGAGGILSKLVGTATPLGVNRSSLPIGYQQPPYMYGYGGPVDISSELSNVPAAALPSLLLFIILAIAYAVLLGPINFLALRRWGRREWSWVTIPALALMCVGATFGLAFRLKGNTVLINSIGIIQVDGNTSSRPATLYSGLFAPVRGDYHLSYSQPAFASGVQSMNAYAGPGTTNSPLTLRFQQGQKTDINFLNMNMWSMRDIKLQTSADVPGSISSHLVVDSHGYVVGTVHNGTHLNLVQACVLAGRSIKHLPALPAGSTVHVRVKPSDDLFDQSPVWFKLYGQPNGNGVRFVYKGRFGLILGGGPRGFYPYQGGTPALPSEHTLADRIRNVATMLPEAWTSTGQAQVMLLAWTEQPIGVLRVDGVSPQRRDLNLITSPLSVQLSKGSFRLEPGTVGANIISLDPRSSTNGCCPGGPGQQTLMIGNGGSGVFEFDLASTGHVHFHHLTLSVNAGGADGTDIGHVFDWKSGRWEHVNLVTGHASLTNPDRFVSPGGRLLLSLKATGDTSGTVPWSSQDITIIDPHQMLQISGSGIVT